MKTQETDIANILRKLFMQIVDVEEELSIKESEVVEFAKWAQSGSHFTSRISTNAVATELRKGRLKFCGKVVRIKGEKL